MTAMWQDHVGRVLLKPGGNNITAEDTSSAVDAAQEKLSEKTFNLVRLM